MTQLKKKLEVITYSLKTTVKLSKIIKSKQFTKSEVQRLKLPERVIIITDSGVINSVVAMFCFNS